MTRHRGAIHAQPRGNATRRPAELAEHPDLLLLGLLQDVAHPGEGHQVPRPRQRLGRRQLIAGFELSIKCGIWVSTEAERRRLARVLRAARANCGTADHVRQARVRREHCGGGDSRKRVARSLRLGHRARWRSRHSCRIVRTARQLPVAAEDPSASTFTTASKCGRTLRELVTRHVSSAFANRRRAWSLNRTGLTGERIN